MYPESSNSHEIEQITTAILEGKYSWACVLMLRLTGHNPSEYMPYRTYTRLVKNQNRPQKKQS
jgi:hypothetical protein